MNKILEPKDGYTVKIDVNNECIVPGYDRKVGENQEGCQNRQILKTGSEPNTSRMQVRCNYEVSTCRKTERSNKKLCAENNSVQNLLPNSQQLHAVTTAAIPVFARLTMNVPAVFRRNILHISTEH